MLIISCHPAGHNRSYNRDRILIEWAMEDSTLGRIISVEKEIQQRLDLERAKVFEWLEDQRKICEKKLVEEEQHIKKELGQKLEQAVAEAESRASALINEARAAGTILQDLDKESRMRIVSRHIGRVLPGNRQ